MQICCVNQNTLQIVQWIKGLVDNQQINPLLRPVILWLGCETMRKTKLLKIYEVM